MELVKSSYTKHIVILRILLVISLIWVATLWVTNASTGETVWNHYLALPYLLLYLYGGIIGIIAANHIGKSSSVGKSLILICIGLISYAIALFSWEYIAFTQGFEFDPYPSFADVFYILFYPLIALGLFQLLNAYSLTVSKKQLVTTILASLAVGAVIGVTYIGQVIGLPDFSDEEYGFMANLFDLTYLISDIIVIAIIFVVLRVASGKITKGLLFLVFGVSMQLIGDFIFAYRTSNETFFEGDLSDFFYIICGYTVAAGVIYTAQHFTKSKSDAPLGGVSSSSSIAGASASPNPMQGQSQGAPSMDKPKMSSENVADKMPEIDVDKL